MAQSHVTKQRLAMPETTVPTIYFEKPGKRNTERALQVARDRAAALSIRTVLVATTSGAAGVRAAQFFDGYRVVAVTHSYGFQEPDVCELLPEHRAAMEAAGATVLTCGHTFAGISRAVRKKLGTYEVAEIAAYTLRIFGEGMKVVAEIACMAADAGLARTDELAVAIAGTGHGADTAVVLRPANSEHFFDMEIEEILCLPYR
jgi:hypothetical protein